MTEISILDRLSRETGLSQEVVRRIMLAAPMRYKEYFVRKRNGGLRLLSQPAREVKFLQRALVKVLLSTLSVHPSATAYRLGVSIRDNAAQHAGDRQILKLDFKDFFPSIIERDWRKYCRRTGCLENDEEIALTGSLLFRSKMGTRGKQLAIGAPSSPMLANVLLFDFDSEVSLRLAAERIHYTRYADDLTLSATRTGFFKNALRIVRTGISRADISRLQLNIEKTTFVTTKYHRVVTGLTLANDGRVTIGREQKRRLSAAVHRFTQGKLTEEDALRLSGFLAFVKSVEPDFLIILQRKYGTRHIIDIQHLARKANAAGGH